jgi:hypothetical protein
MRGEGWSDFRLVATGPFKTAVHNTTLPNFAARQFVIYKLTGKSFRADTAGSFGGQT